VKRTLLSAVGVVLAGAMMVGGPGPSLGDAVGAGSSPVLAPIWSSAQLTNWAGYARTDETTAYTQATDTFVVPTVDTTITGTQIVSDWVGIGGVETGDWLVQAGIQMVNLKGTAYYTAWTEVYPHPEKTLQLAVEPGDSVTVTVTHAKTNRWLLRVQDGTQIGQRSVRVNHKKALGGSVEVIEERPCIKAPCDAPNEFAHLAQTSDVTFAPGSFSTTPWPRTPVDSPLLISGDDGPNRYVMTDDAGTTLAVPSAADAADDGFTVAEGTTTPDPPSS
jgi:hypothetical protein